MLTNVFPIIIPFEEFNISRIPYSKELLSELRKKHNADYSFFRNGDFIYISPDIETELGIGEELVKLKVNENEKVVSSLIKHIFFRDFYKLFGDTPLSFYPLRFISRKHDIIERLLPDNIKGKIGFKRQVEMQFRQIEIQNEIRHCAIYNVDYKWVFQKSCFDLHQENFNLVDLDVIHSVPIANAEKVLAPEEKLIGTIINIFTENNENFASINTNEGVEKHSLGELFLEKTRFNIEKYLIYKLGKRKTENIFQTISDKKPEIRNLAELQKEIQKLANYFTKPTYSNKDSFTFTISSDSKLPENSLSISNPTYIFDDDDIQKHNNPYFGITSFGPSDKSYFKPKDLKVLVICNSANRASFSNFVETLKKGLPSKSDNYGNFKTNYFADGFVGKYKFHNIVFDLEEIQNYESQSYLTKISSYLNTGIKPDLVILEVRQEFRKLDVVENPYFQVKSDLLSRAISVQFVDNQTIADNRTKEAFYNIISLQMYAKLGGIPWALPTRRSYDKEIVIGVGSYLERKNKFRNNENTKVVGITTFFSGEGRYLLGNKCKEVNYANYFSELLSNLRLSIQEISKEQGWLDNSTVLIIFHIFKPIKMVEAKVVEELISEFPMYKIKYAFVTISDNHPFLLFNANHTLRNPQKGSNLILDKFSCLLQSRGIDDLKSTKHGFPKPLLIKVIPSENEEINFRDLSHIAQQIYSFSNLSFSSFYTSKMPVTILYSEKIAKWLSKLKRIVGWKPEVVNTELKMKKWFL